MPDGYGDIEKLASNRILRPEIAGANCWAHYLSPGRAWRKGGKLAVSEKHEEKKRTPMEKAMDLTIWQSARTDPQGSWTGTPADPWETPVQDADDL